MPEPSQCPRQPGQLPWGRPLPGFASLPSSWPPLPQGVLEEGSRPRGIEPLRAWRLRPGEPGSPPLMTPLPSPLCHGVNEPWLLLGRPWELHPPAAVTRAPPACPAPPPCWYQRDGDAPSIGTKILGLMLSPCALGEPRWGQPQTSGLCPGTSLTPIALLPVSPGPRAWHEGPNKPTLLLLLPFVPAAPHVTPPGSSPR